MRPGTGDRQFAGDESEQGQVSRWSGVCGIVCIEAEHAQTYEVEHEENQRSEQRPHYDRSKGLPVSLGRQHSLDEDLIGRFVEEVIAHRPKDDCPKGQTHIGIEGEERRLMKIRKQVVVGCCVGENARDSVGDCCGDFQEHDSDAAYQDEKLDEICPDNSPHSTECRVDHSHGTYGEDGPGHGPVACSLEDLGGREEDGGQVETAGHAVECRGGCPAPGPEPSFQVLEGREGLGLEVETDEEEEKTE